jgi:AraC-like DNA-binding protein
MQIVNMESIISYKVSNPLLFGKISSIVFWRRPSNYRESMVILPNNICGFGLTLSGDLLVKINNDFKLMPKYGTRNIKSKPSVIKTSGEFLNISVRFIIPNGLSLFTKIPMNVIYQGDSISLNEIFSNQETNDLIDSLLETRNDNDKVKILELFLVSRLFDAHPPIFVALIEKIHATKGNCHVKALASCFSISERTIHRLFSKYVGLNPNKYINLIRFRNIINLFSDHKADYLGNAINVGYYDQSHFIKKFKTFSNFSPRQFKDSNYFKKVSDFYNL